MYGRVHLSRTPENWANASKKRRQTFIDNPEVLARRTRIIDDANKKVGEDGLTGYERAAKGRKETLLKKHGREDYANWEKTKQTWVNKSEEEVTAHGKKISDNWEAKSAEQKKTEIKKREATKLEKYGMPGWKIAYDASSGRRSGIAEEFCSIVNVSTGGNLIFGTKELSIDNKFYDLACVENKKIIEFYGNYWHACPKKYGPNEVVGRKGQTALQIWDADAAKIKLAEDHGYQVKVIWESEYKKNPKKVVDECITWLKQ
jgi:very-short-patch-repair endonuclease